MDMGDKGVDRYAFVRPVCQGFLIYPRAILAVIPEPLWRMRVF